MRRVLKESVSFKSNAVESSTESEGLTRRSLLKNTAGAIVGAAAAGLTGALGARAQVQGLYTYNAPPEFPLPLGSLTYLGALARLLHQWRRTIDGDVGQGQAAIVAGCRRFCRRQ